MKGTIILSTLGAVALCATLPVHAQSAMARLEPTQGNAAAGSVTFTQKGDKVAVEAKVSGLSAGGHGFHIHEKGDCSSADGMSAGGHFNPSAKVHGNPSAADHHVGDMPMLVADASGNASLSVEVGPMTIAAGGNDVVGKAVIVHKDPDDYTTQPTGNSGARIACGVIAKS